jgi:hypothetical protein
MSSLTTSLLAVVIFLLVHTPASFATQDLSLQQQISHLSSFKERTTGSQGCNKAADFIREQFKSMGITPEKYRYPIPVRKDEGASLVIGDTTFPLNALRYNAITPEATDGSLSGPLY